MFANGVDSGKVRHDEKKRKDVYRNGRLSSKKFD